MKYWREIAIAVIAIASFVGFRMWLESHDRALMAEVATAMLKAQRDTVKVETQQQVQTVQQERKQASTPAKQVEYVEKYVPIHLNLPEFNLSALPPDLPNAPGAVIVKDDLPKLADYVAQCETCKVERAGCAKELGLCDQQVKALESGRKTTFWNKLSNCGARAGVGAAAGGLSGDPKKAGFGAAIGIGSCFLWKP